MFILDILHTIITQVLHDNDDSIKNNKYSHNEIEAFNDVRSGGSNFGVILLSFIIILLSTPIITLVFSSSDPKSNENSKGIVFVAAEIDPSTRINITSTSTSIGIEKEINGSNNEVPGTTTTSANHSNLATSNTSVAKMTSRTVDDLVKISQTTITPATTTTIPKIDTTTTPEIDTTTTTTGTSTTTIRSDTSTDSSTQINKKTQTTSIVIGQRNGRTPTDTRINNTNENEEDLFSMNCNCSQLFFANTIFGNAESIFRMGTGDCYHK
jgi:hypothetical protein